MNKQILNMGLVAGRHDIPASQTKEGFIFDRKLTPAELTNPCWLEDIVSDNLKQIIDNDADNVELRLTVTGLTVTLVAVINMCIKLGIDLILLHYDRDTNKYFTQEVITNLI